MPGKLVIDSKEIHLKPGAVIALTLQVNDVGSVDDRQSTFSNTVTVPGSNGNREKLEYADQLPSSTRIPYRKLPAIYYQGGVQVVKNGFAMLNESGEDFELVLFDGNISFFDLIDNKKLSDIDWSDLDHVWDLATVHSFITNTDDVIYPVIDYGNAPLTFTPGTRNVDVRYLQPWIFVHTVIERIFAATGYTLAGKFPASDLYKNLICSLPTMNEQESYLLAKAESTADSPDIDHIGDSVLFDQVDSDPLGSIVVTTDTVYKASVAGNYDFKVIVNWETNATPNGAFIEIRTTGAVVVQQKFVPTNTTGTTTIIVKDLALAIDDIVYCFVRGNGTGATIKVLTGSSIECIAAVAKISYGELFSVGNNLPDMSQKDFVKSILQMYCIMPVTNTVTKTVTWVQFGEIIKNIWQAKDWTSKVHMGSSPKISFSASTYAQKNFMRYKSDDTVTDELGDGSIDVDAEQLPNEKNLISLPFAASKMTVKFDGIDVPEYLRYDADASTWSDGSPRILILDKQTPEGLAFTYIDDSGGIPNGYDENLCYFFLDGKEHNLKFSGNLLSEHYADFISMLSSFKKVTVPMKLTAVDIETVFKDIEGVDNLVPVYLKQYGAFFYINKINQWIDDVTLCDVELVRLQDQRVTTTAIDVIPLLNEDETPLLSEKGELLFAEQAF